MALPIAGNVCVCDVAAIEAATSPTKPNVV
jgi:hypothetical protein